MLVKYLSRRFGYFQDLNSQILLACKEVCMVNIWSNLFYIIFLMTAEFDITVFFPPPPHLDPRGPIKFELVITWDVITAISPYISNKTQRNTTQVSVGRFDDLIWNTTSKKWRKFVELADRATDIMGYDIHVPSLPPTHFAGDQNR